MHNENTFIIRAETLIDAARLTAKHNFSSFDVLSDKNFYDILIIASTKLSINSLKTLIQSLPDHEYMLDTVRYVRHNA